MKKAENLKWELLSELNALLKTAAIVDYITFPSKEEFEFKQRLEHLYQIAGCIEDRSLSGYYELPRLLLRSQDERS